jgi:hypothetical protein
MNGKGPLAGGIFHLISGLGWGEEREDGNLGFFTLARMGLTGRGLQDAG